MSSNKTSLNYAQLHTSLFIPGFGSTKTQLNTRMSDGATQVTSMFLVDSTSVEINLIDKNGKPLTAIAPFTNFHVVTQSPQ
jgi:hypothetical protein